MSIYINLDENQFFSGIRLPLALDFNSPVDAGIFWEKLKEIIPDVAFIEEKSKSGTSQTFDEEDFMFAYDRDGSGNAELFKDGASIGTDNDHDADMSDTGPRNIMCQVVFQSGGFIYGSDNGEHRIAETICYKNDDATTRILCEGYLAHKYGRQNKLPAAHKYRYGPPRF